MSFIELESPAQKPSIPPVKVRNLLNLHYGGALCKKAFLDLVYYCKGERVGYSDNNVLKLLSDYKLIDSETLEPYETVKQYICLRAIEKKHKKWSLRVLPEDLYPEISKNTITILYRDSEKYYINDDFLKTYFQPVEAKGEQDFFSNLLNLATTDPTEDLQGENREKLLFKTWSAQKSKVHVIAIPKDGLKEFRGLLRAYNISEKVADESYVFVREL
jgi:hypothetical protein